MNSLASLQSVGPSAKFLVTNGLLKGARSYLESRGFIDVTTHVPHLSKAAGSCENFDTLYRVERAAAYLTQTEQLYLECLIPPLERVWCIGPSFRAEYIDDGRHLNEFNLLEFEFEGDFDRLLDLIEGLLASSIRGAMCNLDLNRPDKQRLETACRRLPRIRYETAIEKLGLRWGDDIDDAHEKKLARLYRAPALFLTHHPKELKYFNMETNDRDPRVVNSADLILDPGGEVVGAAARVVDWVSAENRLVSSPMFKLLAARSGSIQDFQFYLEHLRLYPNIRRAGCGIGVARLVQFVLSLPRIELSTAFPVYADRVY